MQQRHMVRTVLQSAAILKAPDQCPVARSKQRTAFPPNYIHSLDSSHMMMTASECSQAGARLKSESPRVQGAPSTHSGYNAQPRVNSIRTHPWQRFAAVAWFQLGGEAGPYSRV